MNASSAGGELTAEVLDDRGRAMKGLSAVDCVPIRADKTQQAVTWKAADLSVAANQTVRLRFHMKNARIFAFWVSRDESGASHGYVAAGGPGLTNRSL